MSLPPNTIIVFEEGGVVQWVAANPAQNAIVISYDRKADDPDEEWDIWREAAEPWELEPDVQAALDKFLAEEKPENRE